MKDKYLPIGTVVLLKNGKKELMILSYGVIPQGELEKNGETIDGKNKFFDYGACTYPEGLVNSTQIAVFNHDQIEKVCYMGYETEEYEAFNKAITGAYEEIKKQMN